MHVCKPAYAAHLNANADRMRHKPTKAEAIFARRLKDAGVAFLAQVVVGRYIVDFVIPERMLVIELEGSIHWQMRKRLYDKRREQFLESCGFKVKRLNNRVAETWHIKLNLKQTTVITTKRFRQAIKTAKLAVAERAEHYKIRVERQALDYAHRRYRTDLTPRLVKAAT